MVKLGFILKGQIHYYKERGISLDEYIHVIGLRELVKENKLQLVIEQFVNDEKKRKLLYKKYKKEYFVMKPLNFKNILPFE